MTEIIRRTPAASMNYLADAIEAALNGDPKQLRTTVTGIVFALRSVADEKARADLTAAGDILMAALNGEGISGDVASRIWNRFMFGAPEGLASR